MRTNMEMHTYTHTQTHTHTHTLCREWANPIRQRSEQTKTQFQNFPLSLHIAIDDNSAIIRLFFHHRGGKSNVFFPLWQTHACTHSHIHSSVCLCVCVYTDALSMQTAQHEVRAVAHTVTRWHSWGSEKMSRDSGEQRWRRGRGALQTDKVCVTPYVKICKVRNT